MYYNYISKDLNFGLTKENELEQILKQEYDETLNKTSKYCCWDYEGDGCVIEIKSRKNTYNKYPTTMIGQNKIDKMMKLDKKKILIFCFTDGVYYFILDENSIDKCRQNCYGGRFDRGFNEYKSNGYCFIPIEDLTLLVATVRD